jgi:hypothetical protein
MDRRDLASGFHHVKLSTTLYVPGRLQRYVVLAFGASQSPPSFVELTGEARNIFESECDRRGLSVKLFV